MHNMDIDVVNMLMNLVVAVVALCIVPWARNQKRELRELTTAVNDLKTSFAVTAEQLTQFKRFDDFMSSQTRFNETMRDQWHKIELQVMQIAKNGNGHKP